MKYIIDIEDEYTKDWVNETPMCKELCMPISVPNRQRTYHITTGFKLEPYTESDREAIENEVWDFVSKLVWSFVDNEILGMGIALAVRDMTYQEAKAKYEAWRKQKDKVCVGDEVTAINGTWKGIVMNIDDTDDLTIMDSSGQSCNGYKKKYFRKTGNHFDEIEELLNKMRDSDD